MSNLLHEISNLIAANQTEEAIRLLLEKVSPGSDIHSLVVLRSSDFKELKTKEVQGILTEEELARKKNQINLDLLKIVQQLEERPIDQPSEIENATELATRAVPEIKPRPNWKWLVPVIALGVILSFFIFRNVFSSQPEYRWWKLPNSKDFKLERLIPGTNNYKDITANIVSYYDGTDVIVYEKTSNKTLLLHDYEHHSSKKIAPTVLEPISQSYWKMGPDRYRFFIYDKGEELKELSTSPIGNDLVVYCATNQFTYLIRDYIETKDEDFHPVEILKPQVRAYWKVMWQSDLYFLIDKGIDISKLKPNTVFDGKDMIVDHPLDSIRIRLENYQETHDEEFRAAIIEPR